MPRVTPFLRSVSARARAVYVRAHGSIDPPDAPISTADNVTYTLTSNIASGADGLVVERDNTVVDGSGFTVQGTGSPDSIGIDLTVRTNVTINNAHIDYFDYGVWLNSSSDNTLSGNNITANSYHSVGIELSSSSSYNRISGNNITSNNVDGIRLSYSSCYNSVSGNNIANNTYGIWLVYSSNNNSIFHNSFVNNNIQVDSTDSANVWDDGCEGNYWSDYAGADSNGDGIGDTPYIIDSNNTDHYPLMNRYWIPADVNHDLIVNIFDVVKITGAYGATPASPYWNPHADIAEPFDKIDILDVVTCTGHYGEKYP